MPSRLSALYAAAALCVALALGASEGSRFASADGPATIFVESKAAAVGDGFSTEVIAILPPETVLRSFDIQLAFDERSIIPLGTRLNDGWQPQPQTTSGPGEYRIAALRGSANCAGPGSCTLASVAWKAEAAGDSSIRVTSATLQSEAGPLDVGAMTAGLVHVSESEAAAAPAAPASAGAGARNLGIVLFVCAVAGAVASLPLLFAVRWLRRRRAQRPASARAPATRPSPPALDLVGTAAEYLTELEVAGRVFPETDPLLERMAREASSRAAVE